MLPFINHIPNFSYLTNFVSFATHTKGQFTRSHISYEVDSWHNSRQLLCKQSKPESVLIILYNWHVSYSIVPFTWSVHIASHNIVTGYRLAYYAQCEPGFSPLSTTSSFNSLSPTTVSIGQSVWRPGFSEELSTKLEMSGHSLSTVTIVCKRHIQ